MFDGRLPTTQVGARKIMASFHSRRFQNHNNFLSSRTQNHGNNESTRPNARNKQRIRYREYSRGVVQRILKIDFGFLWIGRPFPLLLREIRREGKVMLTGGYHVVKKKGP